MSKLGSFAASVSVIIGLVLGASACSASAPETLKEESTIQPGALKAKQFCGGFANLPCPEGFVCVDDPNDGCDPAKGGADCGGICKKEPSHSKLQCKDPARQYVATSPAACQTVKFSCAEGTPFFDACGCGCLVPTCAPVDCGPALGMPITQCPDGVNTTGPTGNCILQNGACGWEISTCP